MSGPDEPQETSGPSSTQPSPEAFVEIYTRYEQKLYRHIASLLPHPQDAEDVLQETAKVLWRKFAEYCATEPFLPWASAIARYEVRNYCRREQKRRHFTFEMINVLSAARLEEDGFLEAQSRLLGDCVQRLPAARPLGFGPAVRRSDDGGGIGRGGGLHAQRLL